eukprot:jgi/Mesvir1/8319/Mv12584-RA.1
MASQGVVMYLQPSREVPGDDPFANKMRVTPDGMISKVDVVKVVCFMNPDGTFTDNANTNASQYLSRVKRDFPEDDTGCVIWKFPGARQRDTPVTDRAGIIKLIQLLPGKRAASFRDKLATLFERYLDADRSLADEIYARADARDAQLTDDKRVKSCESTKAHMAAVKESGAPYLASNPASVYAHINETQNVTVTGMHTRDIRELHKMKKSDATRDYFTEVLSSGIDLMNVLNKRAIEKGGNPITSIDSIGKELFPVFERLKMHEEASAPQPRSFALANKSKREEYNARQRLVLETPARKRVCS